MENLRVPGPLLWVVRTYFHINSQPNPPQAWDDVERRVKPVEKPYDYSRSRPLDHEKSKLSLAKVYEQEYIKQTQVGTLIAPFYIIVLQGIGNRGEVGG